MCRPHKKSDVFVLCFLYRRSNLFETRQVGKVVQHCKNILYPSPDKLRGAASHQTQIVTSISNWPQRRQLHAGAVKKFTFSQKGGQNQLWMKSMFFAFYHLNHFFGTHGPIPAILKLLDLILSTLSHSQSPQHSKKYLQCLETKSDLIL